jgi:hypothetical protein
MGLWKIKILPIFVKYIQSTLYQKIYINPFTYFQYPCGRVGVDTLEAQ